MIHFICYFLARHQHYPTEGRSFWEYNGDHETNSTSRVGQVLQDSLIP